MWQRPKNGSMVLAQAVELDVLHDHHAARGLGEERLVDHLFRVRAVAMGEECERLRHAQRRPDEPFARRVLAELHQELPDQQFDFLRVRFHGTILAGG